MMCRWTVRAAERLKLPGAQDRARQLQGRFIYDPHVSQWLEAFLDDWLGDESKRPAPAGVEAIRPTLP
jgi:GMP synthase (glutamine-hydrolysing)